MQLFIGIREGDDQPGRPAYAYDAHAVIDVIRVGKRWIIDVAGCADAAELLGLYEQSDLFEAGQSPIDLVHGVVTGYLGYNPVARATAIAEIAEWNEHAVIWMEDDDDHGFRVRRDDEMPAGRLADLLAEYGGESWVTPGTDAELADVDLDATPFVLVQENVRGGYWLSAHASANAAGVDILCDEYGDDWSTVMLVDLRDGTEYGEQRSTSVMWEQK
jgi:hypothetical protein